MTDPLSLSGIAPVDHLGVLRAHGADAAAFLQGQLTNDVAGLDLSSVRLAGFCSAKGRLQASFIVWRKAPEEFFLVCARDVLAATLKRLSMFVLRAKCRLTDASGDVMLWGVAGEPATRMLEGVSPWQRREIADGELVRLPDAAGVERGLCVVSAEAPRPLPGTAALSAGVWRWLEVQSGIVTIEAATVDRFVPQMVNYELVGGVDFRKGCFPGQEVVARSQYRGTAKRRTFLFDCEEVPVAGQDVFVRGAEGEAVGTVANAAPTPGAAGGSALVELRLAALSGEGLALGAQDGALLHRRALPYDVPLEPAAD